MKMMKKLFYLFIVFLLSIPASTESASPDSQAFLQTIWKAQTIEGLDQGIWVIPEDAINQYFVRQAEQGNVKNPVLNLTGENRMLVAFDSQWGKVALTCEIKRFVHNQTESYAEVYVQKKEIAGKPIITWMLNYISIGAIADLYGNPLKDIRQVDARISGNTLKINFRPLVERSLLNNDFGKKIEINEITTRKGALELHTNMKAADLLGVLMGK